MTRFVKFGFCLALFLLPLAKAPAQIFKLDGGTSTLFNADGGSLSVKAPNYEGNIGAGMFEGHFQWGAVARTKLMGYTLTAGDDSVRFDLPTDVFGNTSYFSARGVGLSKGDKDSGFYVLGGVTSRWSGTGFFQAARSEDPAGVIFFHHRLTDELHFYSRDIVSTRSTALQGLEWVPQEWLKTSFTGGIGSGQPYFASGIEAELPQLSLKASYASVDPDFRRVTIPDYYNSEPERENIEATYRFNRENSITASHRNLLQPLSVNGAPERAGMNSLAGNFRVAHTYFGAGLFNSSFSGRNSWGSNFFAGQHFGNLLDVSASYFVSKSTATPVDNMLTGTFREMLTPRINLLQVVTYSNGQWSTAYGGEFITNRFNARLDYQTVYLPFRTSHPFQQTLSFNSSVRVIGPVAITAASTLAPDGRVRYTFGGTTYLYRYSGLLPSFGQENDSYKFPKYLVQGFVRDEQGHPVSGAAIQLGQDIIYTDGTGHFLYRTRKHRELMFSVVPDQFLMPGVYEVIQAPKSVTPEKEGEGQDVEVIVRRLTAQEAMLRASLSKPK
ncbi:MAG TPA: hypothetical protein VGF06_09255 [Terriglobales bacterium]|jgi:hypothetical protein